MTIKPKNMQLIKPKNVIEIFEFDFSTVLSGTAVPNNTSWLKREKIVNLNKIGQKKINKIFSFDTDEFFDTQYYEKIVGAADDTYYTLLHVSYEKIKVSIRRKYSDYKKESQKVIIQPELYTNTYVSSSDSEALSVIHEDFYCDSVNIIDMENKGAVTIFEERDISISANLKMKLTHYSNIDNINPEIEMAQEVYEVIVEYR